MAYVRVQRWHEMLAADYAAKLAAFEAEHADLIAMRKAAALELERADADLRLLRLEEYGRTQDKGKLWGAGIRDKTTVRFGETADVVAWCQANLPLFVTRGYDAKGLTSFAKEHPDMVGTIAHITTDPEATIGDVAAAVEAAGLLAAAVTA